MPRVTARARIRCGVDPDHGKQYADGALATAVRNHKKAALVCLLATRADPDPIDQNGVNTPLRLTLQCMQIRGLLIEAARQRKFHAAGLAVSGPVVTER